MIASSRISIENKIVSEISNRGFNQRDISRLYLMLIPFIKKQLFNNIGINKDELAHDIFVKFFYKIDKINLDKGNIFSYVESIAKNAQIDILRKQNNSKVVYQDISLDAKLLANGLVTIDNAESLIIKNDDTNRLHFFLNKLDLKSRLLIEGFYFENKTLKELGNEHCLCKNTVSVKLFRIKNKLEAMMKSR